jgi:hypothetical protein
MGGMAPQHRQPISGGPMTYTLHGEQLIANRRGIDDSDVYFALTTFI